jgi:hypothetical protein
LVSLSPMTTTMTPPVPVVRLPAPLPMWSTSPSS